MSKPFFSRAKSWRLCSKQAVYATMRSAGSGSRSAVSATNPPSASRTTRSPWPMGPLIILTGRIANRESNTPALSATQPSAQIRGSSDLIPPILSQASGVVLDIGPGTGTQMPLLRSPAIRAIYGAEPCLGLHSELRARAASEGLADKYHILPCGVEACDLIPTLQTQGLLDHDTDMSPAHWSTGNPGDGVFDTIICVRVLCSVPNMQRAIRDLYTLLRPGGKLLVVEHVVNPWRTPKGSVVARGLQAMYGVLGWSWYMGNCCLNRDTADALKMAAEMDGGWEFVELERWFETTPMPYVSGVLVKRPR
ncbi:S-adenosyl-L-methionine-dependent methyltransferase [Aspergillus heteromorphus CBS 117.55]|uniref:S-adenosyl-L-methionine-dependent methyltransferase n=1 Tax=Aspergillus heteromorphus CBS 117.55 TaxID=1448321 RepID=A0A317V6K5_9EURO|nr:S-adenosyl-L-methionine-dependent methyltransferase [Aspergillus heteromorphus CBS 117.55]PWY69706.1 S-adenosyl-L-methionine-dependent methyltransferase [Aspergillus heteromorphus CBS 117.55]